VAVGLTGEVKGFLAEVRPVPMALVLATVAFGSYLAAGPAADLGILSLVLANAFLFLYAAHLNDTFFDLRRGEYGPGRRLHYEDVSRDEYLPRYGFGPEVAGAPLLPPSHYLAALAAASAAGSFIAVYVASAVGWLYLPLALTGLGLALSYSAGLDRVPALGDTMWEVGVLAALFCGFYSRPEP